MSVMKGVSHRPENRPVNRSGIGQQIGQEIEHGWSVFYLIGGHGAKCRMAFQGRGQAAATASNSQLAIISAPPAGAANGNRLWPAYWRKVRSVANSAAAITKPHAAA